MTLLRIQSEESRSQIPQEKNHLKVFIFSCLMFNLSTFANKISKQLHLKPAAVTMGLTYNNVDVFFNNFEIYFKICKYSPQLTYSPSAHY